MVVTDNVQGALWLLNAEGQQSLAHAYVLQRHDVRAANRFDDDTLAPADIVYLTDFRSGDAAQLAAFERFVRNGGRLIVVGDHTPANVNLAVVATHFGVRFGRANFLSPRAQTVDFDNPITAGPAGRVSGFSTHVPNGGLTATAPGFRAIATFSGSGDVALGFQVLDRGEVVYLTDVNTFDDDVFNVSPHATLWANLFTHSSPAAESNCWDATGN